MKRRDRIALVAEKAALYGDVDGEQSKMWVIDQMLTVLLGAKGYKAFVKSYEEDFKRWEVGIPP